MLILVFGQLYFSLFIKGLLNLCINR